jgi:HEAT repeat protein
MDFSFIEDEAVREKAVATFKAEQERANEEFQAKLDEEVGGLKNKVEELLGEKKTIQEQLQAFGEIKDPQKALEALQFLQENEDARLIKEGRVDELVSKRTSDMKLEHEKQVEELTTKLQEVSGSAAQFQSLYENKMRDDEIRNLAIKAGVLPVAINDVLLRASQIFALGKDASIEARTKDGKLLKDESGNVITPTTWIEGLKESSPHYWPTSEGTGARGGGGGVDGDILDRLATLAKQGKMKEYNELREKMKAGK